MRFLKAGILSLAIGALVTGCGSSPHKTHPEYAPSESMDIYSEPAPIIPTGSIYHDARPRMVLFEDLRARQVGDILTVLLSEATDAEKSSDTSLNKDNALTIANPLLAGKLRTFDGDNSLGFDLSSSSGFDGDSASTQSNSLQGSITVTVAKVLPGGNLYIQGEKWIQINQGNEYIRMRGIIRPVDIAPDNTILSTLVADARISYGGTGPTADVNRVGWLSRFFISPIWPF